MYILMETQNDLVASTTAVEFAEQSNLYLDGVLAEIHLPAIVNGNHWVLFNLSIQYPDPHTAYVSFRRYDSFTAFGLKHATSKLARKRALEFLGGMGLANGVNKYIVNKRTLVIEGPQQRDVVSCGYYVMAKMENLSIMKLDLPRYRKRVRAAVNERITTIFGPVSPNQ